MRLHTRAHKFFSRRVWNPLPAWLHRWISKLLSHLYNTSLSSHFIPAFCSRYLIDQQELDKFTPASGAEKYQSFQDFFTRQLKHPLVPSSDHCWPCDGRICESGEIKEIQIAQVKGQHCSVLDIFGIQDPELLHSHHFVNKETSHEVS